jgi:hypothetical protein
MGRAWVWDRPLVVASAVLIVAAAGWAVWVHFLPSGQRDGVIKYAQFVLPLVAVVIAVLGGVVT